MMEQYVDLGDENYKCIYCGALFWFKESIKKTNAANEPLFTLCCQQGKIKLPISKPTPHLLENLLDPGECPKFAQLYIYDTHNETMNRLNAVNCEQHNEKLDGDIVQGLIRMFDESNELTDDGKQYEQPTCDEIGGLVVGDIGLFDSNRDIVVELQAGELKRITKLNPKFMSLQYPILFPYGEDGYRPNLKWSNDYKGHEPKRERVPMRAFIAYQIQERGPLLDTLHYGNPDLFITFICNVKWPEIVRELDTKPGYKGEDRPDLISRVFKMKLDDMISYIKSGEVFGEVEA
ncbi:unnamed protein product, partial [Prunus armeniaca]